MPLKDVVKVSRKTFFNPMGWLGYDMLKAQFRLSRDVLKDSFTPAEPTRKESFAEAMKRLNVTEEDVIQTATRYFLFSIVFVVLGLLTAGFGFYLLFAHGSLAGFILGLVSATLFVVYAFRYNFWYFQIKHRKLGCTFDEWRSGKVNEEQTP
jgi:intracellular multiplication protein IcmV